MLFWGLCAVQIDQAHIAIFAFKWKPPLHAVKSCCDVCTEQIYNQIKVVLNLYNGPLMGLSMDTLMSVPLLMMISGAAIFVFTIIRTVSPCNVFGFYEWNCLGWKYPADDFLSQNFAPNKNSYKILPNFFDSENSWFFEIGSWGTIFRYNWTFFWSKFWVWEEIVIDLLLVA